MSDEQLAMAQDCECGWITDITQPSGERYVYCLYHLQTLMGLARQHAFRSEPPHPANIEAPVVTLKGRKLMGPSDLDERLCEILQGYGQNCIFHEEIGAEEAGIPADDAIRRIKALFGVAE